MLEIDYLHSYLFLLTAFPSRENKKLIITLCILYLFSYNNDLHIFFRYNLAISQVRFNVVSEKRESESHSRANIITIINVR